MKIFKRSALVFFLVFGLQPAKAFGDFFGGDLPMLAAIVANTAQELTKLQSLIGKGQETVQILKELNQGVKDAMAIIETHNRTLSPGVLSDLRSAKAVLTVVEDLYGRIPPSAGSKMQGTMDASVAESIHLHNEAFRYADRVDPEAERIKVHAKSVNPVGASKLTAQALGVLIHVMNQILRTNAAILKIQSEQLALQNRKEKLGAQQLKAKYDDLSKAFSTMKPTYRLPSLSKP